MRKLLLAIAMLVPTFAVAQEDTRPPLTVGVNTVRANYDPGLALGNVDIPITYNMFDTLVARDFSKSKDRTSYQLVPGLAESWKQIDDRTTEFSLRPDVHFHNGQPLTSADVKFTFDRILDPASDYVEASNLLKVIERIDAVDDLTVRITTKAPSPILLQLLAYHTSEIVPKAYFESVGESGFGQKPVGTGPFDFVKLQPDESIDLKANDSYFRGRPTISRLTFRSIPEVSGRITALANGEVDIINSIPPDQLKAVESLGCCEVRSVLMNHHFIQYNTYNPVMADVKLRQALNLAINRQLLVDALWDGKATLPHSAQYEAWGPELYDPNRPTPPFDPDRARQLLKESSYKGQPIFYVTHPVYYTNGVAVAEAVVQMWKAIGVNASVRVDEGWTQLTKDNPVLTARNSSDWVVPTDPAVTLYMTWSKDLWKDEARFDELAEEGETTLDSGRRHDIYQKMIDLFEEEAPGTYLYRAPEFYGVRSGIEWLPNTEYTMDFRRDNIHFTK
ncbi:ABC transporter substrate-binding protein [Mesorhizobium sp. SEMIA 3007]|uniref:ABC transporter substrate-binding protein n=1 Tax=Mesorhizobium sp. SEMIA 3007 TaxID=1862350 RepID=UPI000B1591CC|nr:ABC transporter substrate-binding protein [Mesorhizobium sp. SEMIA 3007]